MMKQLKSIWRVGALMLALTAFMVSCTEDDDTPVVASFQFEIDADNFLQVTFSNFSSGAVSYAWEFGDEATSTEENPVHTYQAAGSYTVRLTATSASGESAVREEVINLIDPLAAQRALIGDNGKTWYLVADVSTGVFPLQVGPISRAEIWWAFGLFDPVCIRACIFDDTWTFNTDGTFTFENNGDFWAEEGIWAEPGCFDTTAPGAFVGAAGQDLSAWNSGTHPFEYNTSNQTLTINGGFIGLTKAATTGEVDRPQSSVTYNVLKLVESAVDTLVLETRLEDFGYWQFTLVSYNNPADRVVVTLCEAEECTPLSAVSPSVISHTFASNDASQWNLMQPVESGSQLELGADDPADASAPKVGKFIRTAAQFQEMQFRLSPANAINFTNLTKITLDVYLPSSNNFAGALTDNVFVGFGATTCPPNWWEDLHQYEATAVAKDQWVTLTFQLNAPNTVAQPGNGATVFDRSDMDMIFIQIGGGNHTETGEFFVRNFRID
jgi:PKD repeat protein